MAYVLPRVPTWKSLMTLIDFLILAIVAAICGSLGQGIVGFSRGGCLVAMALGFIGAVLGYWLKNTRGLPEPLMYATTQFNHLASPYFGRCASQIRLLVIYRDEAS